MDLRYGLNPQQQPATAAPVEPGQWPVAVRHGEPSYINMLDALNAWQLVRDASLAVSAPVATSFKHVSPAGAATAGPIDPIMAGLYHLDPANIGALTSAYARARDADPKSSYGDFVAISHEVDTELADLLGRLVCDGIIAPGYAPGTLDVLSRKKRGQFLVIEADEAFTPPEIETREVYGVRLTQSRDPMPLSASVPTSLPAAVRNDLLLGLATLRYTQSNSVCFVRDGMTLGIGAGQQSRIDCTALAGAKADVWWLRRHPELPTADGDRVQDRVAAQIRSVDDLSIPTRAEWLGRRSGLAFVSDGALPFRDNVDEAYRHGAMYIAEPGGSIRSSEVADACAEAGITLIRTGHRLFHH